jgi:hypothetical protein
VANWAAGRHRFAANRHTPLLNTKSPCGHLLTTIGLSALYPEGASQVDTRPAPTGYPWHSVT